MIIFNLLDLIFSDLSFLLGISAVSSIFKLYLIVALVIYIFKSQGSKTLGVLTLIFFSGAFIRDSVYVFYFARKLLNYESEYNLFTLIARINWAVFSTKYYSLVLILNHLTRQKLKLTALNVFYWMGNIIISILFLYLAIFKFNVDSSSPETFYFEIFLVYITYLFLVIMLLPTFVKIVSYIKSEELPKILVKQITVFSVIIVSNFLLEVLSEKNLYEIFWMKFLPVERFSLIGISTILVSYALYYCSKKMIGLRYLDLQSHVEESKKFNFISDFKHILEKLSYVSSTKELSHISQMFFNAAFNIPIDHSKFYIRSQINDSVRCEDPKVEEVEKFLLSYPDLFASSKIFIKDEIEFSNFYNKEEKQTVILDFLDKINADIFLPIFELQTIIAYIVVEKNTRKLQLFNSAERDEMLVFTSYLSNIIHILKNNNLELVLNETKELKEELYQKHQEINQYKESLRAFMKIQNNHKIGLLFYKSNRFTNINQEVMDITGIDILLDYKHPIVMALKRLGTSVIEYKTSQSSFTRSVSGERLLLSGIVDPNGKGAIIIISYPEVSALIRSQYANIKDPSKWDYLLYLETTETGKLINQMIPSNSETYLNLKISLMSTALSKKATLLNVIEDDLTNVVSLLHNISLRTTLHKLNMSVQEKSNEVAFKLFGINPLLDKSENAIGLLEKLDNHGTLFIHNIHLLNIKTQDLLADYLNYGYFYQLKNDKKIFSNVRVICSSSKNLQNLVSENLFSKKLYNELNKAILHMPALNCISDQEIEQLAYGFGEQVSLAQKQELNNKDIEKILVSRPVSLIELKNKVSYLISSKSYKVQEQESTKIDTAYHVDDPEISKAIKLGKNALKDFNIMSILWDKYKNQNKIAQLLGVNRSSINRRIQQYNLIEKA